MPPSNTRQEWPNTIDVVNSALWQLIPEPPVSFQSEGGKSYIPFNGLRITSDVLKDYSSSGSVNLARLWSTGLWGLVYNTDSKVYSAVKLFKVDLVGSQNAIEAKNLPYMFYNKAFGGYSRPFKPVANFEFHFLTTKRSPYKIKTSAQLSEWVKERKQDKTPGMVDGVRTGLDQHRPGSASITTSTSITDTRTYEIKVNDFLTLRMPITSHPMSGGSWPYVFLGAVNEQLREKGFSEADIELIITQALRVVGVGVPGTSSSIGGGSTGSSRGLSQPSNTPETPRDFPIVQTITRLPSGASLVDDQSMKRMPQSSIRPQIRQAYINNIGEREEEAFYFDYVPTTISYTLGGTTWNEIPRTLDAPLIEFMGHTLTRVQMSFLIAGERVEAGPTGNTNVPDGLDIDVEDRITQLRRIASRPSPVMIYGLDDIFNIQLQQAQATGVSCNWAIVDLSMVAKRRTGGVRSLISVAQVNLSLMEMPISEERVTMMRPLRLQQVPTPKPGGASGAGTPIRPDLWSAYLTKPVQNTLLVQT